MKKLLAFLLCSTVMISACGNNDEETETDTDKGAVTQNVKIKNKVKKDPQAEKWRKIAGNPKLFKGEYDKLSPAQQYYFCSAFSMGAMSASKPATASAMVSYFLGVGVEKYAQGIDDKTYYAFDMGENIFRYELVVNYILDEKICEKVMIDATDYVKEKKISTDEINEKGKFEARKIVEYINKSKK